VLLDSSQTIKVYTVLKKDETNHADRTKPPIVSIRKLKKVTRKGLDFAF